ncbi:MAG: hypothetical protein PHY80_04785 [Rickettsiales bacterium]|nr:hypothetical protein [Rickettsiales bacterium]
MKRIYLPVLFLLTVFNFNNSFAAVDGGDTSSGTTGSVKNFNGTDLGLGVSLGYKLSVMKDIYTFDDSSDHDYFFINPNVFYNNYFSQTINQNYGVGLDLGYGYKNITGYVSAGYVGSSFDYKENSTTQSMNKGAAFVGFGFGYDLTKNVVVKVNTMFYSFDVKPNNSAYEKVAIDLNTVNLQLGFNF